MIKINYPERTPINSVVASDCGAEGVRLVFTRSGGRILVCASEERSESTNIVAELSVAQAARLFHACLTMTGPAQYDEGEPQP